MISFFFFKPKIRRRVHPFTTPPSPPAHAAWQALKTREEMRAAGIGADPYTYDALATACGLAGDWRAAESVVRELLAVQNRLAAGAEAGTEGSSSVAVIDGAEVDSAVSAAAGGGAAATVAVDGIPSRSGNSSGGGGGGASSSSPGRGELWRGGVGEEGRAAGVASGDLLDVSSSSPAGGSRVDGGEANRGGGERGRGDAPPWASKPKPKVETMIGAEGGEGEGRGRAAINHRLQQKLWRRKQLEDSCRPTPQVLHGLMEAYARAGEWRRALGCLDDMARGSASVGWEWEGGEGQEEEEGEEREGVGVRAGIAPDATSVGWAIQVGCERSSYYALRVCCGGR